MNAPLTNEDQIQYWNEQSGSKWVAMQEALDAQLGPLGDALLDRAVIQLGETVLDIGCGCGALSLDLASRVTASGKVTGVDVSAPMLARARERAGADGFGQVEFVEGDAQTQDFKGREADAAVSRFGVMFFADPKAAFANIRTALKPGGRVAFICWQPLPLNTWVAIPLHAAAQHIEMPQPPPSRAPGPFSLGERAWLQEILDDAGYVGAAIESHVRELAVGGAVAFDRALEFIFDVGPLSRVLREISESDATTVRGAVREAVEPFYSEEGLVMTWSAWIVTAANPA